MQLQFKQTTCSQMGNNNCNWTEQKRQPPSGPGSGGLQPLQKHVHAEVYHGLSTTQTIGFGHRRWFVAICQHNETASLWFCYCQFRTNCNTHEQQQWMLPTKCACTWRKWPKVGWTHAPSSSYGGTCLKACGGHRGKRTLVRHPQQARPQLTCTEGRTSQQHLPPPRRSCLLQGRPGA